MSTSGRNFRQEIRNRIFREPRGGFNRSGSGWSWIGVYMACVGVFGSIFGSALVVYSSLTPYLSWSYVFFGLTVVLWTAPELLPRSSAKLAGALRIGAFASGMVAIILGVTVLLVVPQS